MSHADWNILGSLNATIFHGTLSVPLVPLNGIVVEPALPKVAKGHFALLLKLPMVV